MAWSRERLLTLIEAIHPDLLLTPGEPDSSGCGGGIGGEMWSRYGKDVNVLRVLYVASDNINRMMYGHGTERSTRRIPQWRKRKERGKGGKAVRK